MNLLLELLFPRRCPICDKPIPKIGTLICHGCLEKTEYVKSPFCLKCGKEVKDDLTEYCYDCTNKHHEYIRGRALYEYSTVCDSIYRFKYAGRKEYAEAYGQEAAKHLGTVIKSWKADALVPVPIHKKRLRRRGYNQATLFAAALGRELQIPVIDNLISRVENTKPMKMLSGRERQNNLKKAFKIGQNDVKLDTIIIIDDIYTTGSTIDALAREIKKAGVTNIYFIALAIGEGI